MNADPIIEVLGATRQFRSGIETIVAVDQVDFEASAGQMVCLYGASGSGKSTLLNLIAGLDLPDAGIVRVAGREVSSLSERERAKSRLRHVGVVFQDNNLVGEFTAGENVVIPLLAAGYSPTSARREANEALERVGIAELFDRFPANMSGGQRQRVGIARALSGERRVLLADEPTGALDSANSRALFDTIATLCRRDGVTAVVATHDPLAREHADRVLVMCDGRISPA